MFVISSKNEDISFLPFLLRNQLILTYKIPIIVFTSLHYAFYTPVILTSLNIFSSLLLLERSVTYQTGTTLTTTKEFIFPIDEEDLITLSTNTKELEIKSRDLTKEEWSNIIAPPGPKVLRTEFMMWHCRLNHLPFIHMFTLSEQGYLPKRFILFNNNQHKLYFPSCIFAKMKSRPWRSKGQYRPIRK